jgi:hypothetical protein
LEIVSGFGLPAFYNAEVAAVFSAAICFFSLSLCSLRATCRKQGSYAATPPPLCSFSLVASRIFASLLLRENNGDSFRVVNRFYSLQLFCVFILRVICPNFFLAICFKFQASVSGFRPTVAVLYSRIQEAICSAVFLLLFSNLLSSNVLLLVSSLISKKEFLLRTAWLCA